MRYRKLVRFPIVAIILLTHCINPFRKLEYTLPQIKKSLSDREKNFIINSFLSEDIANNMRELFYED